jgi:cyclase
MRKTIWMSLILLSVSAAGCAQTTAMPAATLPFTIKPLGNNVYAAIDDPKGGAGSNSGFVIGDDGDTVIDTFVNPAAAKQLLAEIQKLTKLPVRFVVNTHYHLDHVAGNGVFAETGALIIGHRNIRGWIHSENLKFFGKEIKPEQRAMVEGLVAPSVIYDSAIELYLGSRRIVVRYYPGHTGGDSVVSIPDAQVVFCGDLFWKKTLPNLIDGTTEKWVATDAKLAAEAPKATFVPGHGDVGNAADVQEFAGYLNDLRTVMAQPVKDGLTGDALANAVMPKLQEKYGSWNFFDYFLKRNISDMAKELRGEKQIPKPPEQQ